MLHLFDFFPLCVFECVLKLPAQEDAKSHWLHLFDFSLLCLFKCFLKALAQQDAKSHSLHLFDFSLLCIFKCLLKSPVLEETYSHWLHSFDLFLVSLIRALILALPILISQLSRFLSITMYQVDLRTSCCKLRKFIFGMKKKKTNVKVKHLSETSLHHCIS